MRHWSREGDVQQVRLAGALAAGGQGGELPDARVPSRAVAEQAERMGAVEGERRVVGGVDVLADEPVDGGHVDEDGAAVRSGLTSTPQPFGELRASEASASS
jgi:hypothetical protein